MPIASLSAQVDVYYEVSGEGYPLVLIPGYCCDHSLWDLITPILAQHFKIVVFDNLGSGQTQDSYQDLCIEKMAQMVLGLIQQLNLKRPHIMGHSMGGMIAQQMAKQASDQLGKLMLLNTSMKLPAATTLAFGAMLRLRQENTAIDDLLDLVLPWIHSNYYLENPIHVEDYKTRVKQYAYPQSVENQARQFEALIQFDSHRWINAIPNSSMVIGSAQDFIASAENSRQLAEQMADSQCQTVIGGHLSVVEQTDNICQFAHEFFNR